MSRTRSTVVRGGVERGDVRLPIDVHGISTYRPDEALIYHPGMRPYYVAVVGAGPPDISPPRHC